MMVKSLDEIDCIIIRILDENGRATATEISKTVNLSIPAVSERIRNLEQKGIIDSYSVKINRKLMGYTLLAFVFVDIALVDETEVFKKAISNLPEVIESHHIAGEHDLILKVLVEDTERLEEFISEKLKRVHGVSRTKTLIVMSTLNEKMNREIII